MTTRYPGRGAAALGASLCLGLGLVAPAAGPLYAAEATLTADSGATLDDDLADALRAASLSLAAVDDEGEEVTDPQELIAAAQADYRRLLAALYDRGHFSGAVSILIDGREASGVSALNRRAQVERIEIRVAPGPVFTYAEASVTPLPDGLPPLEGFAVGQPASTGQMRRAAQGGVDAWRQYGHAKARVDQQQITANHARADVTARFQLAPGPQLSFGEARLAPQSLDSRVRPDRILAIAGLPEGERYDPDAVVRAETRLRRTGTFASAVVEESETISAGDRLDHTIAVEDAPRRRLGAGAEISTQEGLSLSGYWMHRNLTGRADRLRLDAAVEGIGGETGGMDYSLSAFVTRPAFRHPDMDLTYGFNFEYEDEPTYQSTLTEVSAGVDRYITDHLTGSLGLGFRHSLTSDALGDRNFDHLTLSTGLTWDNRDDGIDPTTGGYAQAEIMPFLGLSDTESGVRATADVRGYMDIGETFVVAQRFQAGMIAGPSITGTPSDWLFWSGGGGSVRGQGYKSLGVTTGTTTTGGRSFLGSSTELRARFGDAWGAAAFVDYGFVGQGETFENGEWHGGAGLGARYFTPIGPIRMDLAVPITGDANSISVYVGIGQAF